MTWRTFTSIVDFLKDSCFHSSVREASMTLTYRYTWEAKANATSLRKGNTIAACIEKMQTINKKIWKNSGQSRIEEVRERIPSLPPLSSAPFLPLPSPSLCPSLPLRSRASQLEGLGERCKLPAGSGAEPQPKSNLVHFSLKIWHVVATVLMIFLRINISNGVDSNFSCEIDKQHINWQSLWF